MQVKQSGPIFSANSVVLCRSVFFPRTGKKLSLKIEAVAADSVIASPHDLHRVMEVVPPRVNLADDHTRKCTLPYERGLADVRRLRADPRTVGDRPNFANATEQNETAPLAFTVLGQALTERPTVSHLRPPRSIQRSNAPPRNRKPSAHRFVFRRALQRVLELPASHVDLGDSEFRGNSCSGYWRLLRIRTAKSTDSTRRACMQKWPAWAALVLPRQC